MARLWFAFAAVLLLLLPASPVASDPLLTSGAGQRGTIPCWDFKSSASVEEHLAVVSAVGYETASWHHVETSRCTFMGCLLHAGKYRDSALWYSTRLQRFDWGQFLVPWLYRHEFSLAPADGQHFLLETHGITASADLHLNGKALADKEFQAGSFGGHTYDVTSLVAEKNALVAKVYPANLDHDLVQGFVDWNPRAPDNGSGIWRDVVIKQTGSVSMGPLSVSIHLDASAESKVTRAAFVTVRADAHNLDHGELSLVAESVVSCPSGFDDDDMVERRDVTLGPGETKMVEMVHVIASPKIWWPKRWGEQPLYSTTLTFTVNSSLSDRARQRFGIRTVRSHLNRHGDVVFTVNGHAFQVLGAGYSPDHFLRWSRERFEAIANYTIDMGLNTIRLEGTLEHPELYDVADEMGIMIIAGWVCCSKWESWPYNDALRVSPVPLWTESDYRTANASMRHEAAMLQPHPSVLAFLVGSDYWPDDGATEMYVDGLVGAHWQTPIISSASKRGHPDLLGPSGMKMDGPYDWVPPNYWYDTEPSEDRRGAAFGFGSELGAGAGVPELKSLERFLSRSDRDDIWLRPRKELFHLSTNTSAFSNHAIYGEALAARYGAPRSVKDYVMKAQMMDYEATRAQQEAYSAILHWNLFDRYMHPAGAYFGAKVGSRIEHVAYDYVRRTLWLVNHSLDRQGPRTVGLEMLDLDGTVLHRQTMRVTTKPNAGAEIGEVSGLEKIKTVVFLRILLVDDASDETLSRNVYWVANTTDRLDWANSTWYHTPVTYFADLSALCDIKPVRVRVRRGVDFAGQLEEGLYQLEVENTDGRLPAFFVRLTVVDETDEEINPVLWSDNYVTLWPGEKMQIHVQFETSTKAEVKVDGSNVRPSKLALW
ncbi:exo-beta-D-glucosaminidase [Drechmeria coniospora]|uniref:Exo-beta-D-glucosaminidase n=1 Tax=Drechmeria coniospora TaxID=98403 RepID=A0A151GUT2_DRECN|nr:exo-beta-D-glucosaminidase [Drechmeria coniospora]KYK60831.1 exo-beta-D-glucosaminidase [Drechmeria coniospora]